MGVVAIRDDILNGVETVARERGLTPQAQAEEWLRESLERHSSSGAALKAKFEAIASMSPADKQTDSLDDLREVRNR